MRRQIGFIARLYLPPPFVETFGRGGQFFRSHATPRPLEFDRGSLTFIKRAVEFRERLHEGSPLTERWVGPADIAEPLEDMHEFLMTELERRRCQEQHAVEGVGHRSVARSQRFG